MSYRQRSGLGLMIAVITVLVMYVARTPIIVYAVFMAFSMIGLALFMSD